MAKQIELRASQVATTYPAFWKRWVRETLSSLKENWDGEEDVDLPKIKSLKGDPDAFLKELGAQGFIESFSRAGDYILVYSALEGGPSAEASLAYNTKTGDWDFEPYDNKDLEDYI